MSDRLIAIVGPTASGKSSIAHRLALEHNGSIICADSQTLRRDLDIGTAKPSVLDRKQVEYYGLDIINPYDSYSAASFKEMAIKSINTIIEKGKIPIIVGGTGLYVDAVLYDYTFRPTTSKYKRSYLEELDVQKLHHIIDLEGYHMPENHQNKRHLVRVIESGGIRSGKKSLRSNAVVYGVTLPKEELKLNIYTRAEEMVRGGLIEECESIVRKYGMPPGNWNVLGYRQVFDHLILCEAIDKVNLIEQIARAHWQYARRQMTWFKRSSDIKSIKTYSDISGL